MINIDRTILMHFLGNIGEFSLHSGVRDVQYNFTQCTAYLLNQASLEEILKDSKGLLALFYEHTVNVDNLGVRVYLCFV